MAGAATPAMYLKKGMEVKVTVDTLGTIGFNVQ